jgi:hypothetical protein
MSNVERMTNFEEIPMPNFEGRAGGAVAENPAG